MNDEDPFATIQVTKTTDEEPPESGYKPLRHTVVFFTALISFVYLSMQVGHAASTCFYLVLLWFFLDCFRA